MAPTKRGRSTEDTAEETDGDGGLDWVAGMSRWMARKKENRTDDVEPDEPLERWMELQRREYWLYKQGKQTTLGKESFDMLGNLGFDWGDEPTNSPSEEPEDAKPPAQNRAKTRAGEEKDVDDEATDTEEEEEVTPPPKKKGRVMRTVAKRSHLLAPPAPPTASTSTEPAPAPAPATTAVLRRTSRRILPRVELPPPKTLKKTKEAQKDEVRILARLVPVEENDKLIEQVKQEFKELLVCGESPQLNPSDDRFNQSFERSFFELLVFKKAYGHCFVPKIFPENPSFGRWVCKVRHWNNTGSNYLTDSRRKRLDKAGFVWDPKSDPGFWRLQAQCIKNKDSAWEETFQELLKFKEKYGHAIVPKEYKENRRLALWTLKQRRAKRSKEMGESTSLDDERERRLVEVGFVFNTKTPEIMRQTVLERYQDRWEENIKKLKKFKKRYGHVVVPRRWKEDLAFSSWVMRQRAQWRKLQTGRKSHLTEERITELTELGFVFGPFDRKDYPVDNCGVWPKAYQRKRADGGKSSMKKGSKKDKTNDDGDDEVEVEESDASGNEGDGADDESTVTEEDDDDEDDDDDKKEEDVDSESDAKDAKIEAMMTSSNRNGKMASETIESEEAEESGHVQEEELEKAELVNDGVISKEEVVEDLLSNEQVKVEAASFVKGRWQCQVCSKDEFLHYVDACAHQATCSGMKFASVKAI